MSNKEIRFVYDSAFVKMRADGKYSVGGNCKDKKVIKKLQNLLDAIAGMGNDKKRLDNEVERALLSKLDTIFSDDGDWKLSEEELAWADSFKKGDDVEKFINAKFDEVSGARSAATQRQAAQPQPQHSHGVVGCSVVPSWRRCASAAAAFRQAD